MTSKGGYVRVNERSKRMRSRRARTPRATGGYALVTRFPKGKKLSGKLPTMKAVNRAIRNTPSSVFVKVKKIK